MRAALQFTTCMLFSVIFLSFLLLLVLSLSCPRFSTLQDSSYYMYPS